jgi:hypothetical protein
MWLGGEGKPATGTKTGLAPSLPVKLRMNIKTAAAMDRRRKNLLVTLGR